jgi:hypothetical protein
MRQAAPDTPHAEVLELLGSFRRRYSLAEAYSAYQLVHAAASAPFSTALPSTLFHAAHFLLARLVQVGMLTWDLDFTLCILPIIMAFTTCTPRVEKVTVPSSVLVKGTTTHQVCRMMPADGSRPGASRREHRGGGAVPG